MPSAVLSIINKKGLHARAAAKFVKTVSGFSASVQVVKLGQGAEQDSALVTGSSILGLMMLGADPGSQLRVFAEGDDAPQALAALQALLENRFGEEE